MGVGYASDRASLARVGIQAGAKMKPDSRQLAIFATPDGYVVHLATLEDYERLNNGVYVLTYRGLAYFLAFPSELSQAQAVSLVSQYLNSPPPPTDNEVIE